MSTDPIHEILTDFSNQIRAEVQRQAMAALSSLDSAPTPARVARIRPSGHAKAPESKGTKRDPALIDKLQGKLLSFVKQHPGLRIEQINKELGTTTKELALPIRKLIASKAISTRGEKRSTAYHAAGSAKTKTVANKTVKRKKPSKPSKRKRPAKSAPAAAAPASE